MLKTFHYNDPATDETIQTLKKVNLDASFYLLLLVGPWIKGKREFAERVAAERGEPVSYIDMQEIISMNEEKSYQKIEERLSTLDSEEQILYFTNGDLLGGPYTGHTYSKVRYATPQERFFLKKIRKIQKIVMIDLQDEDNMDQALASISHAAITFDHTSSILRRFLGSLSVHGHKIISKRPA